MSSGFDEDLRRQVERLRRAVLTPAVREALRQADAFRPRLQEITRLQRQVQLATSQWVLDVRRQLEAFEAWGPKLPEVLEATRAAVAQFRETWERSLPDNWRDLEFAEIQLVAEFMEDTGWALVWAPRAEVVRSLVNSAASERERILLEHSDMVLDDLEAITEAAAVDPALEHLADANREAIDAYRAGHTRAAQALAGVVFTATFHVILGFKSFKAGRAELDKIDPQEAAVGTFRRSCVLRVARTAIDAYFGSAGEPVPTRFNRHASAHRVPVEQFTPINALGALMLTSSLIREFASLGEPGTSALEEGT
jgi:hypothetical protein